MALLAIDPRPVTLTGRFVELVPLSLEHLPRAKEIGLGQDLFRWFPSEIRTADEMDAYFAEALQAQRDGSAVPFSTFERATGLLAGGSRYMAIDRRNRRLEIGSTWIAKAWQRSPVNTEAKLLMLEHAFERLGCLRVEFKTDSLNEPSRTALARIGARQEGIFRNHMVTSSGRIRHSVWFSIIDSEWPAVKAELQAKLARGAQP
jgi:RimJ/RimL family protein N-acetyltransferase